MPHLQVEILCANCLRQQPDVGKGQTCAYCGTSPLPSYKYTRGHGLHPVDCGCTTNKPKIPVRERKTPVPTLRIK